MTLEGETMVQMFLDPCSALSERCLTTASRSIASRTDESSLLAPLDRLTDRRWIRAIIGQPWFCPESGHWMTRLVRLRETGEIEETEETEEGGRIFRLAVMKGIRA